MRLSPKQIFENNIIKIQYLCDVCYHYSAIGKYFGLEDRHMMRYCKMNNIEKNTNHLREKLTFDSHKEYLRFCVENKDLNLGESCSEGEKECGYKYTLPELN